MATTAAVVYIGMKIASNYTVPCLEPISGVLALRRLMDRLRTGLPAGEFEFYVVFHDEVLPERLKEAFQGQSVQIFKGTGESRLTVLGEFCKAKPHLKTLLVFPEEALFPDCGLAREMLQKHKHEHAEATTTLAFPEGLAPEIFETKAITRLAGMGLPEDLGGDIPAIMAKANVLFEDDKEMNFKCASFFNEEMAVPRDLKKLPAILLVQSGLARMAAEAVLAAQAKPTFDSSDGYRYKEQILRLHEQKEFTFDVQSPSAGQIPVLYSTKYLGFSGAEESFSQMIIHMDKKTYQPIVLLPARTLLSEKLTRAGIPVILAGRPIETIDPLNVRYFESLIKQLRIRLVHLNGDAGVPIAMAARAAGIPIVYHVRTNPGRSISPIFQFGSKLIAVSESTRNSWCEGDIDPEKICRIYNGVDLSAFDPTQFDRAALRKQYGIDPQAKVICMVARPSEQKRQHFLLEALPLLLKTFPKTLVLFVGEPYASEANYLATLRQSVEKNKLAQYVRFWGFEEKIAKIYAMSDVMTLCTLDEPFPRCSLESLAMGCPAVVPDRGGPGELITHNKEGLLYDAKNPQSLATALIQALSDGPSRQLWIQNGHKKIRQFTIQSHVEQVSQVYNEILNTGVL